MKEDHNTSISTIDSLVNIVISVIKDLSDRGKQPDQKNLSLGLAANQKLKALLEHGRSGSMDPPAEYSELLTRLLLTVIKMARQPEQPGVDGALNTLKNTLSSDPDLTKLESASRSLKNEVIKAGMGVKAENGVSLTVDVKKSSEHPEVLLDSLLVEVKQTYFDIMDGLDIDLGNDYVITLNTLRQCIEQEKNLEDLFSYRGQIEGIIRAFAQQVFEERNKANAFIAEIARRLAEMEHHLVSSVENIRKDYKTNTEFARKLESEISQTATTVRTINEIEKLKGLVLTKLNTISHALKNKHNGDRSRIQVVSRDLGNFRQSFDQIQEEVFRVQEENKSLMQKLMYDSLTGVYNRFAHEQHLSAEMNRYLRYRRPFALIIMDLDNFKNINDNYGHLIGDKCLQETIANIKPALRKNDILARYGGDEFVIILPETNKEQGSQVAEKIRQTIEMTDFLIRGQKLPLTISLGVTAVDETDLNQEAVFCRADQALFQAKRAGRNQIGIK